MSIHGSLYLGYIGVQHLAVDGYFWLMNHLASIGIHGASYHPRLPGWRVLRWLGLGPEAHTQHHMTKLRRYSRQIVEDLQGSLEDPAGAGSWGGFHTMIPAGRGFSIPACHGFSSHLNQPSVTWLW